MAIAAQDGYIVSDCGGVRDLGNSRYPAEQQCIANVAGKVHNDNRSSCFLPPLPKKGQSVAGVAMNAGCDLDCGPAFTSGLGAALKSGEVNATRLRQVPGLWVSGSGSSVQKGTATAHCSS